jgi:hypothetical protein
MEPKIDLTKLIDDFEDTISIDNPGAVSGSDGYEISYNSDDTITLSSYPWSNTSITVSPNVTLNSGTYSVGAGAAGGPYSFGGAGTASPWTTYTSAPQIQLDGEDADIKVNGWSLVDAVKKIEERLNILHPNTELETEWEELRALGEQYRKLEQHIKDKQATWDKLKAMPPPAID